jgi:hypothetical protein
MTLRRTGIIPPVRDASKVLECGLLCLLDRSGESKREAAILLEPSEGSNRRYPL